MRIRGMIVGAILAIGAGLGAGPDIGVALADAPPGPVTPPEDTGKVGVHALVDTPEYTGVICHYDSGTLDLRSISVRRPILYARDRSPQVDHQRVAWRYQVYGWDGVVWHLVDQSALIRANASDVTNAPTQPRVYTFASLGYDAYRIRHRLAWYQPSHPQAQEGTAVHWSENYRTDESFLGPGQEYCYKYALKTSVPPPSEPGHSGRYGVDMLLDTIEYPGQTCIYDTNIELQVIRVRPPIVSASAGVQHQKVGWRYRIQKWNTGTAHWDTKFASPILFDTTSDTANATFPAPHRFAFHGSAYVHTNLQWRSQVQLFWYATDGTIVGRAAHSPGLSYVIGEGPTPYVLDRGSCVGSV